VRDLCLLWEHGMLHADEEPGSNDEQEAQQDA
jgi:hypothetical protein